MKLMPFATALIVAFSMNAVHAGSPIQAPEADKIVKDAPKSAEKVVLDKSSPAETTPVESKADKTQLEDSKSDATKSDEKVAPEGAEKEDTKLPVDAATKADEKPTAMQQNLPLSDEEKTEKKPEDEKIMKQDIIEKDVKSTEAKEVVK